MCLMEAQQQRLCEGIGRGSIFEQDDGGELYYTFSHSRNREGSASFPWGLGASLVERAVRMKA